MSRRYGFHRIMAGTAVACVVAVLVIWVAGCSEDDKPFDPLIMQRMTRAYADENSSAQMRPLPTRLESPYLKPGTQPATGPSFAAATQPGTIPGRIIRRMTLQQLVHIAVAHNSDAKVTAYQPAIDQARVVEAEAAFDLKYFANFQFAHQDDLYPTANEPNVNPFTHNTLFQNPELVTGIKADTPTGGSVEFHYQTDQFQRSGPGFSLVDFPGLTSLSKINPFWVNSLQLQIKQPLLQNFGAVANEARIAIARNTQRSSLLDFRLQLEKSLYELEEAYWNLVNAEQTVKIDESLLQATNDTAGFLKNRVGTENTTNTEVAQANAAVQLRAIALIDDRRKVEDLSDKIKAILNDPDMPVSMPDLIVPADVPIDTPVVFDDAEQIRTALTFRPELAQQQLKIDNAAITVRAAKNNELPQLDLVGQVGFDGFARQFDEAVNDQLRFDFVDYTVGFQFTVPIGNREARAITVRSQYQRLQAIESYRGLIDQITADVITAQRDVVTSWRLMVAARQARIGADEELRRLNQDMERPGSMNPGFIEAKLEAQLRLSTVQQQEITAMTNYNLALAKLERAKGTLLRYDNVTLEEEPRPTVPLTWK